MKSAFLLSVSAFVASGATMAAVPDASPLQQHMQRMLTDGDQWRTPNPGYEPEKGGPQAFGLTFELADDGSHVTGDLTGIHADGRESLYWTLLAFYNPVTMKVVVQQIGGNGTLMRGDVDRQPGPLQIVDMVEYAASGEMRISRHENRFETENTHVSDVLEPDGNGGWKQTQTWAWTRHRLPDGPRSVTPTGGELSAALEPHAGYLVAGSGRWRTPNPEYEPGGTAEHFYGMNYRVGPHGQHVVGEIVSIYDDGRETRDWSLYMTWNPVTHRAWMEQTGASGVYFRGELAELDNGRRTQTGVIYAPNGMARSVRDEVEIIDDETFVSHVFERADDGSWQKRREWTWVREDS